MKTISPNRHTLYFRYLRLLNNFINITISVDETCVMTIWLHIVLIYRIECV